MNILIRLESDNNIIFRKGAVGNCKVILTKFRLWCLKIIFNGAGMKLYAENYLKPKTWTYLKEFRERKQITSTNDFFRITTGLRRPRHVFIWVVRTAYYGSQEQNPFVFETFNIGTGGGKFTKAQLEINNSIYYPQLEMKIDEKGRLYRALMSYKSAYNDFLTGTLIDRTNFSKILE